MTEHSTADLVAEFGIMVVDAPEAQLSDPTVWLLTADTMRSGHYDLDNRTELVGVYDSLKGAAWGWAREAVRQGLYHPIVTQAVVQS